MSAELLAALAQVEGSGNPLVRTYWRWSWPALPFDFYRPASSAVGMYQITDPTFEEARHYCIHDHELTREGAWNDWHSCWFNSLYLRVVPADAVELTAADLDLKVTAILGACRASLPRAPRRCGIWRRSCTCAVRGRRRSTRAAGFASAPASAAAITIRGSISRASTRCTAEFARLAAREEASGRSVMVVAAGPVHVPVLEFLGGRGAHVGDLDLEVQVLPGERMVAIEGDQVAGELASR